jgi:hypothetical protein
VVGAVGCGCSDKDWEEKRRRGVSEFESTRVEWVVGEFVRVCVTGGIRDR